MKHVYSHKKLFFQSTQQKNICNLPITLYNIVHIEQVKKSLIKQCIKGEQSGHSQKDVNCIIPENMDHTH